MSGTGPSWPTMAEYQEAVQSPPVSFLDPELRDGVPVMNKLGLPRPMCGMFASVYELERGSDRWAVKCFVRNIPDLHSRYAKISDHLKRSPLPYFVTFEYQQQGIRVRGNPYPLVKMQWVEGLALNHFLEQNLNDRAGLEDLAQRWLRLLEDLQSVSVAHGDLQHGNVLVSADGELRLIDYDGMWVPKLKGQGSHETGHPDYQSPLRTGQDFGPDMDAFAGDVIHAAIRALARKPDLWQKYNNGDNLLFRRQDYLDPQHSDLFRELRALRDSEIDAALDAITAACGRKKGGRRRGRFLLARRAKAGGGWKRNAAAPAAKPVAAAAPPSRAAPPPRPAPPPKAAPPPRPAPAPPRRAAPPPRPAPRPPAGAPPSGGPANWLSDHVTGGPRPAAGPPKPASRPAPGPAPARRAAPPPPAAAGPRPSLGRRLLGYTRLVLHLLLLGSVITAFVMQLVAALRGEADHATNLLLSAFGLAGVLGIVSLTSLYVLRVMHRSTSTLFFGLSAALMLANIFAELLSMGWSGWTGDDPLQCALMLAMLGGGVLGLLVESICERLGVVTRWHRAGA